METNCFALPASVVLATASYFSNSCFFRVLAVFTTVFTVFLSRTIATDMCALLVVCHTTPPAPVDRFSVRGSMLELPSRLVKERKQAS
jgi:hypothetical protein